MIVDVVVSRSTKKLYAQQFNRRDLHAKENVSTDTILILVYALNAFIFISLFSAKILLITHPRDWSQRMS